MSRNGLAHAERLAAMRPSSTPPPDPDADQIAAMEATKAAIRAAKDAEAWPRSGVDGVHWDGERWEVKVRREGSPGRHTRLGRFPDPADAARALRAALRDDPALRPGGPTVKPPEGRPPGPPPESIPTPGADPARARSAERATVPEPAPPTAPRTLVAAPPPAVAPVPAPKATEVAAAPPTPCPTRAAPPPPPRPEPPKAAVRAVLDAVKGLPRPKAKWAVFAALAHLEQVPS